MSVTRRAIVLLSGGVDSATTPALATCEGFEVYALSFHYGKRHAIELEFARRRVPASAVLPGNGRHAGSRAA